jgi:hypothetical protein
VVNANWPIPDNHGMSQVRDSVAGTIESKLAILKVMLPEEKTVAKDQILEIDARLDGALEFKAATANHYRNLKVFLRGEM